MTLDHKHIALAKQQNAILEKSTRRSNISLRMLEINTENTQRNIPRPLQEGCLLCAVFCVPQLQDD